MELKTRAGKIGEKKEIPVRLTEEKGLINMNFRMPIALKRSLKIFCAKKSIPLKDFLIYSIKQTLENYDKANPT